MQAFQHGLSLAFAKFQDKAHAEKEGRKTDMVCCQGKPQILEKLESEPVSRSYVGKVTWASGIPSLLFKQGKVASERSSMDVQVWYFKEI